MLLYHLWMKTAILKLDNGEIHVLKESKSWFNEHNIPLLQSVFKPGGEFVGVHGSQS